MASKAILSLNFKFLFYEFIILEKPLSQTNNEADLFLPKYIKSDGIRFAACRPSGPNIYFNQHFLCNYCV